MDFDGPDTVAIEAALDAQRRDGWRRATAEELRPVERLALRAAWRLEVPPGTVSCPGVDHLVVGVDAVFPASQPRVVAPQADRAFTWPHVEPAGILCLEATPLSADPAARVIQHVAWAIDLLNYSEDQRRAEFAREFAAYWDQRASCKPPNPTIYSLVAPQGPLREIMYYADWVRGEVVVAEDHHSLLRWLRNAGRNPGDKQIERTLLVWLDQLPMPAEFPDMGRDVLRLIPDSHAGRILHAGERIPIILGGLTVTGPVLVGALLQSAPVKDLEKGFRSIDRVPPTRILQALAGRPVQRRPVVRVDGPWVYGRDHNVDYAPLAEKTVALIGCGSLGASIARALAQAGVGGFLLIDPDQLRPHNTSRHVLGHRYSGRNKAEATALMLSEDFPVVRSVVGFPHRFEALKGKDLSSIAAADLVISAGVDFATDVAIDQWRCENADRPAHLCTWVEEFAIVGHAVAVFGAAALARGFDAGGYPKFRLTDWPDQSATLVVEAGCGNIFQPHGAVDLQMTVALASRLALDVLAGAVHEPIRRVWQGDRQQVVTRGGVPRDSFADSNVIKEFAWP